MTPNLIVDHNRVTIEGVVIARPMRISPSQWLEFFNNENVDDQADEINRLEKEIERLKIELNDANERVLNST